MGLLHDRWALVSAFALSTTLAACGGGGGGGSASTPAPVSPTPPVVETLALTGAVSDRLGPAPVVTLRVGGETYTTTADPNGVYSLTIEDYEAADFASIRAQRAGDASVTFEALLGTAGALDALAGSDDALSLGELPGLFVTPYTTAETGLISSLADPAPQKADNPDSPIQTDADLENARASVDPADAVNVAATLALIADGTLALPAGQTDTTSLVRDKTARDNLIEQAIVENSEAFETASNEVAEEQGADQAIEVADGAPTTLYFASPNFLASVNGFRFTLDTDGSGTLLTLEDPNSADGNVQAFTWSESGGAVTATLDNPQTFEGTSFIDCDDDGFQEQATIRSTSNAYTLEPLSGSNGRIAGSLVESGESQLLTCDGNQVNEPAEPFETTRVGTFVYPEGITPFTVADVAGQSMVLSVHDPDRQQQSGSPFPQLVDDVLSFAEDGTGSARITGETFSWTIADDGTLVAVFADSGTTTEYRRLVPLGDGTQFNTSFLHRPTEGLGFATAGIGYTVDPAVEPIEAADVPGIYHQFGVGTEGRSGEINEFQLIYNADGTGQYFNRFSFENDNGETEIGTAISNVFWRITDGELVTEFTIDTANNNAPGCEPGSSTSCIVVDRRTIELLAELDERAFVLERRQITRDATPVDEAPVGYFSRFYDAE